MISGIKHVITAQILWSELSRDNETYQYFSWIYSRLSWYITYCNLIQRLMLICGWHCLKSMPKERVFGIISRTILLTPKPARYYYNTVQYDRILIELGTPKTTSLRASCGVNLQCGFQFKYFGDRVTRETQGITSLHVSAMRWYRYRLYRFNCRVLSQ